jgi:uncharacterized membrane protein YphA (DoxX/SURF4 family)
MERVNDNQLNSAALAGRVLLALIFIIPGCGKITGYASAARSAGVALLAT